MLLSIIIPAYNEAKRIEKNVIQTVLYLDRQEFTHELIIVDDGSTDNTKDIAKSLAKRHHSIRFISYGKNHGKGFAVKKGIEKSIGDYIFFIDADGSTPIETLLIFLTILKDDNADVVVGSRNMATSEREITQPMYRQLMGKMGKVLIQTMLLPDISDSQCGFKGFTSRAGKDIFSQVSINRWGFDFEMIVIAQILGYRIKEVPVRWLDVTGSRLRPFRGSLFTLYELILVKYFKISGRYKR